jgi:hypothetical protein
MFSKKATAMKIHLFAAVMAAAMAFSATTVWAHGGGCRKDSPPGRCCHAGSQPYHCH